MLLLLLLLLLLPREVRTRARIPAVASRRHPPLRQLAAAPDPFRALMRRLRVVAAVDVHHRLRQIDSLHLPTLLFVLGTAGTAR